MKKTDPPIIVNEVFSCSRKVLWEALTDLTIMHHWYFGAIQSFEPKVGFTTQFKVHSEERPFTHCWEVLEVLPEKKLAYSWQYLEYPGVSSASFEITEGEKGVTLELTINVEEDFPSDIPEFRRESCIAGWDYFIHGNLKRYLDQT